MPIINFKSHYSAVCNNFDMREDKEISTETFFYFICHLLYSKIHIF